MLCFFYYAHLMSHFLYIIVVILFSTLSPAARLCHAAGADFHPFEQHEQRLRQLEEQQRRQFLTPPPAGPTQPGAAPAPPEDACIAIRKIRFEGATLFSADRLERLARPFEGKCLSLAEINEVLKKVTNLYVSKGYVTSRAVLGPQDISAGVLVVRIVEGKVEDIVLSPRSTMQPMQIKSIFPGVRDSVLDLRDIEQGLDQLNRLPSNAAAMRIEPGADMGGSRVVIDNVQQRTWRLIAGYDNFGQDNTGVAQYTLGMEKDNFIGCNDQFAGYVTASMPRIGNEFKNEWEGNSASLSMLFSIPYGYWLLSGSGSHFEYTSQIYGLNQAYTSKGGANTVRLALDRVIWRGSADKLTLGGFYQYRNVENSIEDTVLLASSYSLTTTGLVASYVRRMLEGVLTLQVEQTWGMPHLSRSVPGPVTATTPHTHFSKTGGSLHWLLPFNLEEQSFAWSLHARGQTSRQTLYGAERMYLGSAHTVRGFRDTPVGGESGGYIRNELAWNVPQSWRALLPPQVGNVQIFGGWDYGGIIRDKKDPYEWGELQGLAAGLRTSGPLSLEAAWSRPLTWPRYVKETPDVWYLNVRYTF